MYCNKCGKQILNNAPFCNNCGNRLNYQNNFTNNTNNDNNKKKIITIIICVLLVGIIVLLFSGRKSSRYYFSDQENNNQEETANQTPKKPKGGTAIIVDHKYSGVSIKTIDDANELIIKDSVDQKDQCPKEILSIEEEFINKYNITAVNLCEMDVDFARELQSVFKKIYDEFPQARKHITNLTLRNTSMLKEGGVIAAFMPLFLFADSKTSSGYPWVIKTQVLLSSKYFLNKDHLQASVEESSKSGHFPPNSTIYSPVAHELGHYLSFLAMMKHYNIESVRLIDSDSVSVISKLSNDFATGDHSLGMIEEAYENYKKTTTNPLPIDEWRGTISQYALAKDNEGKYIYDETVAEAFHDVYLNSDNACEASKFVTDVLKKRLGD